MYEEVAPHACLGACLLFSAHEPVPTGVHDGEAKPASWRRRESRSDRDEYENAVGRIGVGAPGARSRAGWESGGVVVG